MVALASRLLTLMPIMMGIDVVEIRNDCRFDSLPYTDDSVEDLPPLTASTSIEYFIE